MGDAPQLFEPGGQVINSQAGHSPVVQLTFWERQGALTIYNWNSTQARTTSQLLLKAVNERTQGVATRDPF